MTISRMNRPRARSIRGAASLAAMALASIVLCSCAAESTTTNFASAGVMPSSAQVFDDTNADGRIDQYDAANVVRPMIERYEVDRASLRRSFAIPMSARVQQRMTALNDHWLSQLAGVDFNALPHQGRVDYLLFKNLLHHESTLIAHERTRNGQVRSLLPFASAITALEEARRAMEPVDARGAAEALTTIARTIETVHTGVGDGSVTASPTVADRAVRRLGELRSTLHRWHGFYDQFDPEFTWWTETPYATVDAALAKYTSAVRQKLVGVSVNNQDASVGDPIGDTALRDELAFEMIPYSPAELIEIAEQEFAWCEQQMLEASRDLGFGDDWKAAMNHVKNLHVAPGEQPRLIRDLAWEAVAFLDEHDLVTVPELCREIWRIEMMSPARQKFTPYFTGGEVISVAFPTTGMSHEDKLMSLRGNNEHFARATVHHELMPGHHLQGYMTERHRAYRQIFNTPFWLEGWALYWEMLLWDMEFQRSAEDRVGMLFWRMHRCARIIFSLSFHLEQMTAAEAIDFLVERVGHERRNATAEVRRSVAGDYGPLYQAAYMLGGLQIRALHRELVQSGRMSDRAFHDAILHNNSIPIELLRAILTEQPLAKNFQSSWRFYDQSPHRP